MPISLSRKVIVIEDSRIYIRGIEKYEDIVRGTIGYALREFKQGLRFYQERSRRRYPFEDAVILHSYLTTIAPFMKLTQSLMDRWKEYLDLLKHEKEISKKFKLPFVRNFSMDEESLGKLEADLKKIKRGKSICPKSDRRKHFQFYREKYNGAVVASREERFFGLEGKIRFLRDSSQFDQEERNPENYGRIMSRILTNLRNAYSPELHLLAYALITELGPVAKVDTKKHLEDYRAFITKHKNESQFQSNFE